MSDAEDVLRNLRTIPKFACPSCGAYRSKVTNGRQNPRSDGYRRRRECLTCGQRFNTREILDTTEEKNQSRVGGFPEGAHGDLPRPASE
jgi:hypothetical protein